LCRCHLVNQPSAPPTWVHDSPTVGAWHHAHFKDETQLVTILLHPANHDIVLKMLRVWKKDEDSTTASIPPLKIMQEVCVSLQRDGIEMHLGMIRKTFDNVISMFPEKLMMKQPILVKDPQTGKLRKTGIRDVSIRSVLQQRIGKDADIVRPDWKDFENGVVKLVNGSGAQLSEAEVNALVKFKKPEDDIIVLDDEPEEPAEYSPVVLDKRQQTQDV
jgi:hypothetical protein